MNKHSPELLRLGALENGCHAVLMADMALRFPANESGIGTTAPRHLLKAAWDDAAYCLDAPELMPAGACESEDLFDLGATPMQKTIVREAA